MLARLTGIVIGLMVLGAMALPAGSQSSGVRDHPDTECGFQLTLPAGWTLVERTDNIRQWNYQFDDGGADPDASFLIQEIADIKWSLPEVMFGAALVSLVDMYCLDCGKLEWVDTFTHDSMRGGYSIYRGEVVRGGQTIGEGYFIRFYQYAKSDVRGRVAGGYSYARMRFWTPLPRLHQVEPMVMEIMRSFRFLKADRDCWEQK